MRKCWKKKHNLSENENYNNNNNRKRRNKIAHQILTNCTAAQMAETEIKMSAVSKPYSRAVVGLNTLDRF